MRKVTGNRGLGREGEGWRWIEERLKGTGGRRGGKITCSRKEVGMGQQKIRGKYSSDKNYIVETDKLKRK